MRIVDWLWNFHCCNGVDACGCKRVSVTIVLSFLSLTQGLSQCIRGSSWSQYLALAAQFDISGLHSRVITGTCCIRDNLSFIKAPVLFWGWGVLWVLDEPTDRCTSVFSRSFSSFRFVKAKTCLVVYTSSLLTLIQLCHLTDSGSSVTLTNVFSSERIAKKLTVPRFTARTQSV